MLLSHLKNRCKGERLFVVGNGPSLNLTPLEKLHPTFAMNNIALIFDKSPWRPTFYWNTTRRTNEDPWAYAVALETLRTGVMSFIRHDSVLPDTPRTLRIKDLKGATKERVPTPYWSQDPAKMVFGYRMSTYPLMQLAVWMGYNPIYMVGFDMYSKEMPHFTSEYHPSIEWDMKRVKSENEKHTDAHRWIKKYTKDSGVEVFNATIGGKLEVYPRVDLNEII
jgi:hypothetical protein